MRVVELKVERRDFAQTLGALREWIDRKGASPINFQTTGEPDSRIMIRLEFSRDDLGFAFHRHWAVAGMAQAPVAA